jgi:Flp pilus assembly secretin CpaC
MNRLAAVLCVPLVAVAAEPSPRTLSVEVGAQQVMQRPGLARLAVGDSSVVDVHVTEKGKVLLKGLKAGRTTVLTWKETGERESWLVTVNDSAPGGAQLALEVGQKKVFERPGLARLAVGDPAVVGVRKTAEGKLLLEGLAAGRTTLSTWKETGERESLTVSVNEFPRSGRLESLGVEGPDPAVPLELEVGAERVVPVSGFTDANVADPELCEVLMRGEGTVVLKAKKAGETTLEVSTGGMQVVYDVIITAGAKGGPPAVPLALGVGAEKVLTLAGLERFAVSDPATLQAERLGNGQLLLTGVGAGKSTLTVWDATGARFAYAVTVSVPAPATPPRPRPEASDAPPDDEADIELRLAPGTTRWLSIPGVQRVAVGDPQVADVEVAGNSRLKVRALEVGTTSLLSWNAAGRNTPITIVVRAETQAPPVAVTDVTPSVSGSLALDVGASLSRAVPGARRVLVGAPGMLEARVTGAGVELKALAPGETEVLVWGAGAERVLFAVRVRAR